MKINIGGIEIMRNENVNKKICFDGIVANIDLTKNLDKNIIKKIKI